MEKIDNTLIHALNRSRGHSLENIFLQWLKDSFKDFANKDNELIKSTAEEIRNFVLTTQSRKSNQLINQLNDFLLDNLQFYDFVIKVASVGYDCEGMAHSGYNEINDLFGLYFLRGSDYSEEPTEDLDSILDYLALEGDSHGDSCDFDIYINEDYIDVESKTALPNKR